MENQQDHIKAQFSKNLFWDINLKDLDLEAHKAYVVGRVLDRGQMSDWKLLKRIYGLEEIKNIAMRLRIMMPESLAFISVITHTPEVEFRCYEQLQSKSPHWIY